MSDGISLIILGIVELKTKIAEKNDPNKQE
jgi:hypothetical protein